MYYFAILAEMVTTLAEMDITLAEMDTLAEMV